MGTDQVLKKRNNITYKAIMCIILAVIICFSYSASSALRVEAAVNTTKKYGTYKGKTPDKYSLEGAIIYILPAKVYYKGNKLIYQAYIYNNTGDTIYGLEKLKITLKTAGNKTIASQKFFTTKKSMKIENAQSKKYTFTFSAKNVKRKNIYFGKTKKLNTTFSYTYHH